MVGQFSMPTDTREAQSGKHDDRVMAAGIAWQVRKQPKPVLQIARISISGRTTRGASRPRRERTFSDGRRTYVIKW